MKKFERINLIGTVSLDIPIGWNTVSGAIANTAEELNICPGRVEPIEAIREAEKFGGHVLLSDQRYFQENFMELYGRRDLIEGRVKTLRGNNEEYAFKHKGSRQWTTLEYSQLQKILIKKDL